jgi:hypothetical protein
MLLKTKSPAFIDHEVVRSAPEKYGELSLSPAVILKAWRLSLFAHELLDRQGHVKEEGEMSDTVLSKYLAAKDSFVKGEAIIKPVLGYGMMDTIEIGIGREIIAAASVIGVEIVTVSMRKAQEADIQKALEI